MLPGLEQLLVQCAPQVAPDTMMAIVRVESGGNPHAINVNGGQRLARQPTSRQEAIGWASWLITRGYSVDMGLAQVNSRNLNRLGADVAQMFEPCDNIRAGARILSENYAGASKRYGSGQGALRAAISAYNTGNYQAGFANGYVAKVDANAGVQGTGIAPPLIASGRRSTHGAGGSKKAGEPRVFVYGRGGDFQELPRAQGEPLVTQVRR